MASQSFWDSNVLGYWDSQVLSHASAGRPDALQAALAAGGRACASDPSSAGDAALLLAARGGHTACCCLLLAHGADADAQGSLGETALMAAIVAGHAELLELLLPATADLAARTDAGLCPVALACLHRRPWALARLLHRQHALLTGVAPLNGTSGSGNGSGGPADGAQQQQQQAVAEDYSAAPLSRRLAAGEQLLLAMYAAVASGDAGCLRQLAEHPLARTAHIAQFGAAAAAAAAAAPLRMPGQNGCSLQDGLSFLLDASVVGQRNVRAASFLWQTSEIRGVVETSGLYLLARGALLALVAQCACCWDCALPCMQSVHVSWLLALMPAASVPIGHPLLLHCLRPAAGAPSHLAAATDRADCLQVLLSSGVSSPDEWTTSEGFTPLMLAATADAAAAAAVLLQAGAALEARNHASRWEGLCMRWRLG